MGYSSSSPFVILTDSSGSSIVERKNGIASVSDDAGQSWRTLSVAADFAEETLQVAQAAIPDLGIDRKIGTGFAPIWEVAIPGATPPVVDTLFAGGVVQFSAAGASSMALNPTTPGGTAYGPVLGAFGSKSRPWLLRARLLINAAAFTNATSIVLLGLDNSTTFTNATRKIQLLSIGTTAQPGATQVFVRLTGSGGTSDVSGGPDCVLGGIAGIPVNQWFTLTLYFDGINVRWMVNDRPNALNLLRADTGQLDNMPSDATGVVCTGNDTTIGANLKYDDLAFAYCSAQENK